MASSDKTNESAGAHKVSECTAPACRHRQVQKDKKSCEMCQVESTDLSPQRQIHGDVRTEVCKVAVGAFVLANVMLISLEVFNA